MSRVIGLFTRELNIETLKIIMPAIVNYSSSKFIELFEAISLSNLTNLKISQIMRCISNQSIAFADFPLEGVEFLSKSNIESFDFGYWGWPFPSPLSVILPALPKTLKNLKVIVYKTNFSCHLSCCLEVKLKYSRQFSLFCQILKVYKL